MAPSAGVPTAQSSQWSLTFEVRKSDAHPYGPGKDFGRNGA